MEFAIGVAMALAVAAFVSVPLRSAGAAAGREASDSDLAALEAAKEDKYREIRDLELDHAAGKIDDQAFKSANAELRGEAIEILDRLEAARGS